ncbi:VacJ family lipoprotein, partial [Stenotrophomonas acidaminiphila]|nr:VacJ family lipoprotein [Stenotrophomonas acidaminiphila]
MNLFRTLPLLAAVLVLGACAGKPVRTTAPPASASVGAEPSGCADAASC